MKKKSQRRKEKRKLPKKVSWKRSILEQRTEIYLKSAEESILKGNYDSKKLCWEKFLNRNAIRQAQAVTDMGLEQESFRGNH